MALLYHIRYKCQLNLSIREQPLLPVLDVFGMGCVMRRPFQGAAAEMLPKTHDPTCSSLRHSFVSLSMLMLVVARRRLSCSVPPAIRFLFLHFTCFIIESVFSHVCISKRIFIAKSLSLRNLSLLTNIQRLSTL